MLRKSSVVSRQFCTSAVLEALGREGATEKEVLVRQVFRYQAPARQFDLVHVIKGPRDSS